MRFSLERFIPGRNRQSEFIQKDGVQVSLKPDGTVATCTVTGISITQWSTALHTKISIHDRVTTALAQQGHLELDSQHIFLANPQAVDGKITQTKFDVELREGPRPINLSTTYSPLLSEGSREKPRRKAI